MLFSSVFLPVCYREHAKQETTWTESLTIHCGGNDPTQLRPLKIGPDGFQGVNVHVRQSSTGCCSLIVLSQSFWRCSTGDSKKTLFAVPCKLRKVLQYLKSFRTSCSMHWMIRNRAIMSNHPKSCHKIFCWIPGNSIFDGVLKAVHWRRAQIFPTRPGYESSHKLWVADKLARQGGSCWFYITSGWKFL